jgi:hypothetical protein
MAESEDPRVGFVYQEGLRGLTQQQLFEIATWMFSIADL